MVSHFQNTLLASQKLIPRDVNNYKVTVVLLRVRYDKK